MSQVGSTQTSCTPECKRPIRRLYQARKMIKTLTVLGLLCFAVVTHSILFDIPGKEKPRNVAKPNIILVFTDDQDIRTGGMLSMKKTAKLIGKEGIRFENGFVNSPLCCPSRMSFLTAKYVHNNGGLNNSIDGNCSSPIWQRAQEDHAWPTEMKRQGYTTFYAGKYLNAYGFPKTGGVKHVPAGWDWWVGLVGNSRYYNYTLSVNGTAEKHGDNYATDYLTDIIKRRALEFLDLQHEGSDPFLMVMATPAAHDPFTPAPQYRGAYNGWVAPRGGGYNIKARDKHWLVSNQTIVPMRPDTVNRTDWKFRLRLETLMSVDDIVEDVINTLAKKNLLDNTYIFFTSDHGYHLGQFGLPYDKRQLYEFDIRVPFMVRGPGIRAGQVLQDMVQLIDLGPTFVDLAGGSYPDGDGMSLVPIMRPELRKAHVSRETILIEHYGEHKDGQRGCPQLDGQGMNDCKEYCVCEDSWNNTYNCFVQMTSTSHIKYCEFIDNENFIEAYDVMNDPHELTNMASSLDSVLRDRMHNKLQELLNCAGESCSHVGSETFVTIG